MSANPEGETRIFPCGSPSAASKPACACAAWMKATVRLWLSASVSASTRSKGPSRWRGRGRGWWHELTCGDNEQLRVELLQHGHHE